MSSALGFQESHELNLTVARGIARTTETIPVPAGYSNLDQRGTLHLDQRCEVALQITCRNYLARMTIGARESYFGYVDRKSNCGLAANGIMAPIVQYDVD